MLVEGTTYWCTVSLIFREVSETVSGCLQILMCKFTHNSPNLSLRIAALSLHVKAPKGGIIVRTRIYAHVRLSLLLACPQTFWFNWNLLFDGIFVVDLDSAFSLRLAKQ